MLRRWNPPPRNRLARHGYPLSVHAQWLFINSYLLNLQLSLLRGRNPEVNEIVALRVESVVQFDVGEQSVAVNGSSEIDIVQSQLQVVAVERIVIRKSTAISLGFIRDILPYQGFGIAV